MSIHRYWNKKQYECVSMQENKKDALAQAKKWRGRGYLARVEKRIPEVSNYTDSRYGVWIHKDWR